MDRIKQQVDQLQQQLAGLSLSQKMLTATLVAVMIATVVWWAHYAANGERVALLDQALTGDQISGITELLSRRGIEYTIEGDRVFVSGDVHDTAFSAVASERLLPRDTTDHFAKAIGQIGSFDPRQKIDMVKLGSLQNMLADQLRRMEGIAEAQVNISQEYKRQLGGDILPKASIRITTRGTADKRRLADSAAYLVAGPVPMLEIENIAVIVDGGRVNVSSEDEFLGSGDRLLAIRRESEAFYERKILEYFEYIPGLTVSVSVDINDEASHISRYTPDAASKVQVTTSELTQIEESSQTGSAQEPGVVSNLPSSIVSASGPGESEIREQSEQTSATDWGRELQEVTRRPGASTPMSCSLAVPMSYIKAEWRSRTGRTAETPDPAELAQFEVEYLEKIKNAVSKGLQNMDVSRIMAVTYTDAMPGQPMLGGGAMAAVGAKDEAGISGLISEYGKEAAVGALALVSLFLVSTMVKKSAPLAQPSAPTFDGEAVTLVGGDEMAGIAGETDHLLVAQEVSDDAVHAGQMLEQVQTLVKENPDAAAALVKRWLSAG